MRGSLDNLLEQMGPPAAPLNPPCRVPGCTLKEPHSQGPGSLHVVPNLPPDRTEPTAERRATDPATGGQKDVKRARFGLIPPAFLHALAEVYGKGAEKYDVNNWRKGYDWEWSYSALQRHLQAFWGGEETDPESGQPHLAHAAWHCATLFEFHRLHVGTDSRPPRS